MSWQQMIYWNTHQVQIFHKQFLRTFCKVFLTIVFIYKCFYKLFYGMCNTISQGFYPMYSWAIAIKLSHFDTLTIRTKIIVRSLKKMSSTFKILFQSPYLWMTASQAAAKVYRLYPQLRKFWPEIWLILSFLPKKSKICYFFCTYIFQISLRDTFSFYNHILSSQPSECASQPHCLPVFSAMSCSKPVVSLNTCS